MKTLHTLQDLLSAHLSPTVKGPLLSLLTDLVVTGRSPSSSRPSDETEAFTLLLLESGDDVDKLEPEVQDQVRFAFKSAEQVLPLPEGYELRVVVTDDQGGGYFLMTH